MLMCCSKYIPYFLSILVLHNCNSEPVESEKCDSALWIFKWDILMIRSDNEYYSL